jgi:hypothetical protein
MITASLRWPRRVDARAVTASRSSNGDRSWRASTGSARARCERTAFGPTTRSRRAASSSGRPQCRSPAGQGRQQPPVRRPPATVSDGTAALSSRLGTATATGTSLHQISPLVLAPPGRAKGLGPTGPGSRRGCERRPVARRPQGGGVVIRPARQGRSSLHGRGRAWDTGCEGVARGHLTAERLTAGSTGRNSS